MNKSINWINYSIQPVTAVFLPKKSPMRDFIINRAYFFYFVTWISLSCQEIFDGIHHYFDTKNLKTLGGIHETRKSKNWNQRYSAPGWALGPPLRASRSAPALGPSQEPKPLVSIYLIFEFRETTKGFKFSCQNSRETIKNFLTSQWNQVTKKKCAVSI